MDKQSKLMANLFFNYKSKTIENNFNHFIV